MKYSLCQELGLDLLLLLPHFQVPQCDPSLPILFSSNLPMTVRISLYCALWANARFSRDLHVASRLSIAEWVRIWAYAGLQGWLVLERMRKQHAAGLALSKTAAWRSQHDQDLRQQNFLINQLLPLISQHFQEYKYSQKCPISCDAPVLPAALRP